MDYDINMQKMDHASQPNVGFLNICLFMINHSNITNTYDLLASGSSFNFAIVDTSGRNQCPHLTRCRYAYPG